MVWELVTEQNKSGKNFLIGHDINISLNEKAKLRKWIEARTGRPIPEGSEYDISKELGQPCLLNVVEKNGYPKVEGVSGVPKGTTVPPATRTLVSWMLDDYATAGRVDLPEWIPWLFGRAITDHIMDCKEIVTGDVKPGQPNVSPNAGPSKATGSTGGAASSPPASRPPKKPAAATISKFWVALSDAAEPVLVTKDELKHKFETVQGVDWKEPIVCLDGSDQWLDVYTLVPEASSWSPF
jgi:hypothetical protein